MARQKKREASNTLPVPHIPRGQDRRAQVRDHSNDWRKAVRSHDFLDIAFDPLTPMQVLKRAKWMTITHQFRYIATPNVDHVVRFHKEPDLYGDLYEQAWLCVCDSRILEVLSHISDIPLKAVPGSDLTQQLFDNVITQEDTITLICPNADIVPKLKQTYGLHRINFYVPPMGLRHKPEEVAKAAQFIADNPGRYVFICIGAPQSEMIAKACVERGDCVGLGLCVGASLEFITGQKARAPKWIQNLRLEWLHRLASEPRRLWKRYLIEGPKIFWIWMKWSKHQ